MSKPMARLPHRHGRDGPWHHNIFHLQLEEYCFPTVLAVDDEPSNHMS